MQCPLGDGELIAHITHGENNLTVSYSTCPSCHGYWMDSFAANFISSVIERSPSKIILLKKDISCPVCRRALIRTTGDNIPDNINVYTCPDGHGYFFPAGQLEAFKKAQKAKIEYHKLWSLPIPSVASVLLAGFLVLLFVSNVLTKNQITTSQAKQLLVSRHAYVVHQTHEVLFSAQTAADTTLTLHIPDHNTFVQPMNSDNHRDHHIVVNNIPSGSYHYFFTMTVSGKIVQSDTYTFVMSP